MDALLESHISTVIVVEPLRLTITEDVVLTFQRIECVSIVGASLECLSRPVTFATLDRRIIMADVALECQKASSH